MFKIHIYTPSTAKFIFNDVLIPSILNIWIDKMQKLVKNKKKKKNPKTKNKKKSPKSVGIHAVQIISHIPHTSMYLMDNHNIYHLPLCLSLEYRYPL
jgi:hypothetical protein